MSTPLTDAGLQAIKERLEKLGHQWRGTAWTCEADIRDLLTTIDALRAVLNRVEAIIGHPDEACATKNHPEWHCGYCLVNEPNHGPLCPITICRNALTPTTKESA